jgi:surfeit locus 1 family protein
VAGLPAADLTQLPEASRFTAVRNLLYGVEWWVFGGFALFLWWRWVRDETRPTPVDVTAADTVSP